MAEFFSNADVRFGQIEVKDEGVSLGTDFQTIDLVGPGVTATDAGGGESTITITGGGGGTDTFTVPNEYFVDPTLSDDATVRQYQSIEDAIAAGTTATFDPIVIRLAEGQTHVWDGSNLTAAPGSVFIYSNAAYGTTAAELEFASASMTTDNTLTIQNVTISTSGTNPSFGCDILIMDGCTGTLECSVIDTPTPGFKNWVIRNSSMTLLVTGDPAETVGGNFLVDRSWIGYGGFDTFHWDHSGSSEFWNLTYADSTLYAFEAGGHTTWLDTGTGSLDVLLQNVDFFVGGSGFGQLTIKTGNSGPWWQDCRIGIDDTIKPGNSFTFGAIGSQSGLEIVDFGFSNLWPTDAPEGTTARSDASPSYGQMVFDSTVDQWRGDGRYVRLRASSGAIPGIGVPQTLNTIWESDSVVNLGPASIGTQYRVKGTLIAGYDAPDQAVWEVDAIIEGDATVPTIFFRAGEFPVLLYEGDPGQFSAELQLVAGPPTGFSVVMTKNSGSANVAFFANLEIIEVTS